MADVNNCTIIGKLTKNAEMKRTNDNLAICEFSIANNYEVKTNTGWEKRVNYFMLTIYGKKAESLHQYLIKGTLVAIDGAVRQKQWKQDGKQRVRNDLYVNKVHLLSSPRNSNKEVQEEISEETEAIFEDEFIF